jgi:hypothetical protein
MGFPHVYPDPVVTNHAEASMNHFFGVSQTARAAVAFPLA